MIPIRDHNPSGKTPIVTYFLMGVNILAFLFMFSLPFSQIEQFIEKYALIPQEIVNGVNLYSLFTSMFLHGSFGHILSNMLFLNIFGDNLEETLGHFKFLIYYLVAGLGASFLQIITDPSATIPNLGASGAIAGVMGGYLLLFPNHKIDVLYTFGFFIQRISLPAYTMLFYWFLAQLLYGVGDLAASASGGVAFFAHIGGFLTGYLLLYPFKNILRRKNIQFSI